jgi:hypothetical protein
MLLGNVTWHVDGAAHGAYAVLAAHQGVVTLQRFELCTAIKHVLQLLDAASVNAYFDHTVQSSQSGQTWIHIFQMSALQRCH